jgi:tyrosinase
MDLEQVPEMIGATKGPNGISLGSETQSVEIPLRPPTGPGVERAGRPRGGQTYLVLENITARSAPIESYMVYVNLPEGANPDNYTELSAGLLPRFGIIEASRPTREHPGDGLGHSFDITRIVSLLQTRRAWNPERMQVTFVPHRGESETEDEDLKAALPIRVGRISLYYL